MREDVISSGGGTLSEIYQSARKLLLRTRDGLERLERLEYSSSAAGMDTELSFAIKKDITQIQSLCVEMDRLWRSIAGKAQRDLWKRSFRNVLFCLSFWFFVEFLMISVPSLN